MVVVVVMAAKEVRMVMVGIGTVDEHGLSPAESTTTGTRVSAPRDLSRSRGNVQGKTTAMTTTMTITTTIATPVSQMLQLQI